MTEKANSSDPALSLRGYFRLFLLLFVVVITVPLAFVFRFLLPWFWWIIPNWFHRSICSVLGLTIDVSGQPLRGRGAIYVSNHISWKDIFILGAVVKHASFVSKAEVGSNPVMKSVVDLQKTIYVRRDKRSDSKRQSEEMAQRISNGDRLIFFPEGTTTRGVHVQRFKSTLFAVVEMILSRQDGDLPVQPITLSFTHANNLAVLRAKRTHIGWIGEVGFWSHFKLALNRVSTRVRVDFHEPIFCEKGVCRKELAQQCEAVIAEGLSQTHRDRA
ncbi:lysophospholipid acyltransferase family protein [Temperatibacter marinus]|uniref:Lysophospholipid acyltransferase family protein n=1 Tax=Temperatibacter marinus TaxID=1456591 RepID=A0AA52EIA3_9PROT|nr:lysophospholipid acyltransferase family protein [Temperatibacter marinus]WND04153.1 lysophospholipid acyltransferase family protein [Temperatibacter marinus]